MRVASIGDVPDGGGLRVDVGSIAIGLFRQGDAFFAIENACPHAGFPLCEGPVSGGVVTCPAHGFEYDLRTGFATDDSDGFPIPRFGVIREGDDLWLETETDQDGQRTPVPLPRLRPARTT